MSLERHPWNSAAIPTPAGRPEPQNDADRQFFVLRDGQPVGERA
jgi:hypothetical protein